MYLYCYIEMYNTIMLPYSNYCNVLMLNVYTYEYYTMCTYIALAFPYPWGQGVIYILLASMRRRLSSRLDSSVFWKAGHDRSFLSTSQTHDRM